MRQRTDAQTMRGSGLAALRALAVLSAPHGDARQQQQHACEPAGPRAVRCPFPVWQTHGHGHDCTRWRAFCRGGCGPRLVWIVQPLGGVWAGGRRIDRFDRQCCGTAAQPACAVVIAAAAQGDTEPADNAMASLRTPGRGRRIGAGRRRDTEQHEGAPAGDPSPTVDNTDPALGALRTAHVRMVPRPPLQSVWHASSDERPLAPHRGAAL